MAFSLSTFDPRFIGVIAVIAAVVFGFAQLRQFRVQRRDAARGELVGSFQDAQFVRAYRVLSAVPADASAEEFRAAGPEVEEAALALGMRYELIGLLVFREIMPLSLVAQATSSTACHRVTGFHLFVFAERTCATRVGRGISAMGGALLNPARNVPDRAKDRFR